MDKQISVSYSINCIEELAMDPLIKNSDAFEYPYLLVLFSLSIMRNDSGQRCIDNLWAKDLLEHFRYLKQLTIIARTSNAKPNADAVVIDGNPLYEKVNIIEVPEPTSTFNALKLLPVTAKAIWLAMKDVKVVHSGVGSWPIPEAWIVKPLTIFRKRLHLIIVESAFWRASPNDQCVARKLRASLYEFFNRLCVECADLSVFTHQGYMQSLLRRNKERGHVISASWIDSDNILEPAHLALKVEKMQSNPDHALHLVFAGRLTRDKGVDILVGAVAEVLASGLKVNLSVYGEGELKSSLQEYIQTHGIGGSVRLCGLLTYGAAFFEAISAGDIMVVPSITDEQPRIVYDAYSQGLPVLASRTKGLVECVEDNKTGWLVEPKNQAALRDKLIEMIANRDKCLQMGFDCLKMAQSLTHREMHVKRLKLLNALVANN